MKSVGSGSFSRPSVPLIESLKSKAHLIIDARESKNLTHLQSILLFKDSKRGRFTQPMLLPPGLANPQDLAGLRRGLARVCLIVPDIVLYLADR